MLRVLAHHERARADHQHEHEHAAPLLHAGRRIAPVIHIAKAYDVQATPAIGRSM